MAIVIKVKADTRELEADIKKATADVKRSVNEAIGSQSGFGSAAGGGGAAGALNKVSTEASAAQKQVEKLALSAVGATGSMAGLGTSVLRVAGPIGILAVAATAAAKGLADMGLEGAKLADTMLETAKKAGQTVDQVQKLEKGGRDLTNQLRALGGVLDADVIRRASQGTDKFEIFEAQVKALKIEVAAGLAPAFDKAGGAMNQMALAARPAFALMAAAIGNFVASSIPQLDRIAPYLALIGAGVVAGVSGVPTPRGRLVPSPPTFALSPETRDFFRSGVLTKPIATAAPGAGVARVATRAQANVEITEEMMERIGRTMRQGLTKILDDFEKQLDDAARDQRLRDQRFAREAIQGPLDTALEQRLASGRATRVGLTARADRLSEQRQSRVALTGDLAAREKEQLDQMAAQQRQFFEETAREAQRFREVIVFTFESAFREGFERGPKAFFQSIVAGFRSILSQIAAEAASGLIATMLFGKGAVSQSGGLLSGLRAQLGGGGGGGGFFGGGGGGGGGFGGILGGLFGGGGSGSAGIGVPGSISGGGAIPSTIRLAAGGGGFPILTGGTAAGAGAAGFSFLGAAAGPALLGGLLGTGLGGKSLGGKILGGIGGAIAGIGVGLGAAVGLAGGGLLAGALAATGFGLLAAPFIVGAILLGKAKQRRNDEQLADSIWVSEREQVRQLISAVNADRIDGASALAQASALRAETVSQLNQIKTKSVRDSRLSNQLRDLDNTVIAELRAAVERQARRSGNAGFLLPEFGSGGVVPGIDTGRDSVLARVQPGEIILNKAQQRRIQERLGPNAFAEIGVPRQRFQYGGVVQREHSPGSTEVTLVFQGDAAAIAGSLIVRGVHTSSGQRAIVNVIKSSRRNGDL